MRTDFDAIVIGGGPAGSTISILLARAGWRVACVEKSIFPRRKVCGECISASNLPLLDALGIGSDFLRLAGSPLRQVSLLSGDRLVRADLPPYSSTYIAPKVASGSHDRYRWGVALSRAHLDSMLLEQARRSGAAIFQPWTARSIEGGSGSFSCAIRRAGTKDQVALAAPVLIDAHGSWEPSPATAQAQLRSPVRSSDLFAFKANFAEASLEPGQLPLLSFPGGYGGMVIGGHAMATLAFCIRRDTLADCRKHTSGMTPAEAASRYVMEHCAGVERLLGPGHKRGAWLGAGPIRPGVRIRRRGSGIFLIGNAAGEAHPIIGEGISMAIQSAWLLAELLSRQRPALMDRSLQDLVQHDYVRTWKQHFASRIHLSALFAHAAMRPSLIKGVMPILNQYPHLLGRFAEWSGKVQSAPSHIGGRW